MDQFCSMTVSNVTSYLHSFSRSWYERTSRLIYIHPPYTFTTFAHRVTFLALMMSLRHVEFFMSHMSFLRSPNPSNTNICPPSFFSNHMIVLARGMVDHWHLWRYKLTHDGAQYGWLLPCWLGRMPSRVGSVDPFRYPDTTYEAGDTISLNGLVYKCKGWPYSGKWLCSSCNKLDQGMGINSMLLLLAQTQYLKRKLWTEWVQKPEEDPATPGAWKVRWIKYWHLVCIMCVCLEVAWYHTYY